MSKKLSKRMQQLQTKLVDMGVTEDVAAKCVEYTVANQLCGYYYDPAQVLCRILDYPDRCRIIAGGFVWQESPEGHDYWRALVDEHSC